MIAAAYTALVGLFSSRKPQLDDIYEASLAALSDDGEDGGESRARGIAWGHEVAQAVLDWRAGDGFNGIYRAIQRWIRRLAGGGRRRGWCRLRPPAAP